MPNQTEQSANIVPIEFNGSAGEYFKIWIVNVLLTILTLGIYSAWAKVRNKRYFYGNTQLQGSSFEYTAQPLTILKGRMIAVGIIAVYAITTSFYPNSEPLFGLAFLIALPWLVVNSLRFNARNSAYRNVRFDFAASYGDAIKTYILWPALAFLTVGLAYPYFIYRTHRLVVAHSGYGTTGFDFDGNAKGYYPPYLGALVIAVLAVPIAMSMFGFAGVALAASEEPTPEEVAEFFANVGFIGLMVFPILLLAWSLIHARVGNLFWEGAKAGEHRFHSSLKTGPIFWIYLSNTLAIVLSLGLLVPWARVRMTRYRLDNLKVQLAGDLEGIVAAEREKVGPAGEGISDVLDVDVGL